MIDRKTILSAILLGGTAAGLFLLYLAQGIYGGDSGDLVTAAVTRGVPHPPGYPLYTATGYFLSLLPVFTPAWRVGLLSVISHSMVIGLVFFIVHTATKKTYPALFAVVALAGNYLFFLYSTTSEVFALLDLFILLISTLTVLYYKTKNIRMLYVLLFFSGLSLTHHHVILFLFPSVFYLIYKTVRTAQKKIPMPKTVIRGAIFFLLGCMPYAYVLIGATSGSPLIWNNPVTPQNILRLITRADYGSFQSSPAYGGLVIQRLMQIKVYGQLLLLDLTLVGIVLWFVGIIWLWKKNRDITYAYALAILLLGPFFYFYASFPLFNRFSLGTLERFMLQSVILFYPLIGIGFFALSEKLKSVVRGKSQRTGLFMQFGFTVIMFVYPLTVLGMTLWRFWGLSGDLTANKLGEDILTSTPYGAILLLGRDTDLFTTQYVRYALPSRPDVYLIHDSRLSVKDYSDILKVTFPDLEYPEYTSEFDYPKAFIEANKVHRTIMSNVPLSLGENYVWVQYGLVYRLYTKDSLPDPEKVVDDNEVLWARYQDPTAGILHRYHHLMLSDVLNPYSLARTDYGNMLMRMGKYELAKSHYLSAIRLGDDAGITDAYTSLGISYLFLDQCDEALDAFDKAEKSSFGEEIELLQYRAMVYKDCIKDEKRAEEFFSRYLEKKQLKETPLQ